MPTSSNPVQQLEHFDTGALLLQVQLAPMAATPFEQEQVHAWQAALLR
jgi:hypothetical protein